MEHGRLKDMKHDIKSMKPMNLSWWVGKPPSDLKNAGKDEELRQGLQ